MSLQDKLVALDNLKRDFIAMGERIVELENEIAAEDCPIKVGETIIIRDGEKEYQGVVDEVVAAHFPYDRINPTVGDRPTWVARGPRINKGTGERGTQRFELAGNEAEEKHGVWVRTIRSINEILNP